MAVRPLEESDLSTTAIYNRTRYPNPFFDLANNYIPKNIKTLFKFCRTFFYTNGFLRNVVTKLTEYPITDVLFETTVSKDTREKYIFAFNKKIKLKSFMIEVGLDYFTYGNCFISVYMKPRRFFKCSKCEELSPIENIREYKLRNFKLIGTCPKCSTSGVEFKIHDEHVKSIDNFRLLRYAPENIEIDFNPLTGTSIYYYNIPQKIKAGLMRGDKALLKEVPEVFLEALREKKSIVLDDNNLYHFKRPTLAEDDMGWGKPIILPALKEIYYLQTLKRGNEAISHEHVVPKKSIFPANTTTLDPYSMHPKTLVKSKGRYDTLENVVASRDQQLTTMKVHVDTNIINYKLRSIENWDYMLDVTSFGLTGLSTKVNSVHPFRTWNPDIEDHEWKQAKELTLSDYTAYPIKSFEKEDNEGLLVNDWGNKYKNGTQRPKDLYKTKSFLRFLGLYVAEGCVSSDGLISLSFHTKEELYYKFAESYLNSLLPDTACNYNVRGNSTEVRKQNVYLADFLREYVGSNSYDKTLSFVSSYLSEDEAIALLHGLYDGDGTFFYEKGKYPRLNLKSVNLGLLLEVRDLLLSFKVYPTIVKDGDAYQLKLYNYDAEFIAKKFNYHVENYYSEQSNSKVFFKDGFVYSKVMAIKEIDDREVLSIEVRSKCHSYLSAGYINKNTQMNLGKWRGQMEEQIKKWKTDPNHIGVFPIPIGYQELGGNARALLLTPEMKFIEESIINSLGVPIEFIKGGTTWTGSSISLRIVENHFLTYRELLLDFINFFLIDKLVSMLKYPKAEVKFKKFKMSDDAQAKQLAVELSSQGKISDARLLDEFGLQYDEEQDALKKGRASRLDERIAALRAEAEAQGEAMVIQARYQTRARIAAAQEELKAQAELFQEELAKENMGIPEDPIKLIEKFALELLSLPTEVQENKLLEMATKMPTTYALVMKRMQTMQLYQAQELGAAGFQMEPIDVEGDQPYNSKQLPAEKTKGQTRGNP